MNTSASKIPSKIPTGNLPIDKRHELNAAVWRRFGQIGLLILIQAVALFGAAGHLNWTAGWVYLIIYVGFIGLNALLLLPSHKDLIAERGTIKPDIKGWDRAILILNTILTPAMLLVAGFDDRFGWSPFAVYSVRIGAAVAMCIGCALVSWAMLSNAYFSAAVRVQQERGHTVVTTGPYHFVRHPGYVGMLLTTIAAPFILGSIVAFIPAGLICVLIIFRTAMEDRTLQRELDGYAAYTKQIHYRLLPGIW